MARLNKMKSWYDEKEDVLNIQLKENGYWKSLELPNGLVVDIAENGSIIALEILGASKVFIGEGKKVLEHAIN